MLAAALDAAGHIDNLSIVVPVTFGAFLLGLLMSFSRFDGFFALSHSMFSGLAWVLYLMAQTVSEQELAPFLENSGVSELQARVYLVLLRLLDWVDAAISGAASADNYVFMFEICFLMWWLTYLGVWAIFRYGYTWRAIVPAGVVLLINTYYAPQSTIGFMIVFMLVALTLLVRTNLAENQLRWREGGIYFHQDIVWDFLRNGLIFSIVVVTAAWLLPGLGRNPYVRGLLTPINSSWENTAENVQRLYQGLNRQPTDIVPSFGDSLSLGGARNVSDSPVFEAKAIQARYWRAVVFDTFDGRSWKSTPNGEASYAPGEIVPVASWRARTVISQTVTILASVGDVLYGMPEVAQSDIRIKAQVRPQTGAPAIPAAQVEEETLPVEFTMMRADRDLFHGDRYVMISAATEASVFDLENAGAAYPAEILDRYLQSPDGFSPRVTALAQELTAGTTTAYAKAKAIESYLRTIPYNDDIPAPPSNADPIEYFLFELQQGYCDYYATAMAMMLRSVGVPARTASGYAEGIFDEETGKYFVTEQDAHTWVEVFFPEYGWIEFEPTAGESPLDRPEGDDDNALNVTSQNSEPTPDPRNAESEPTPPSEFRPEDQPPPFTGEELLDSQAPYPVTNPWWLVLLGILVVAAVGGVLIWRVRHSGPTNFSTAVPEILFERMQRWAQRLGVASDASETPYEQARALSRALPETGALVQVITEQYVRYRFGRQREDATDSTLLQVWKQLERHFWRAWRVRLTQRLLRRPSDPYLLQPEPGSSGR